ncbi:hypothetical protein SZ55_4970 [Pseudomonas sp. FeS53a]|nr:hypothetical protein SZ55_4970 [Pseudomonas sp. FeS53a]
MCGVSVVLCGRAETERTILYRPARLQSSPGDPPHASPPQPA